MDPIRFRASDGVTLEGEIRLPEGRPRGSAVILHPHPQYGGSKDHPILWNVRNDLARRGFAVLSFNFRGVMGSEGSYTAGVKEMDDARAAIDRICEEANGPTLLVGWSFGANIALRTAVTDPRVDALALIGLPLTETLEALPPLPERTELRAFDRPVLFVVGEADQFCPVPEVRAFARRFPDAEVAMFPDTDHFFFRQERAVAERIGAFAEGKLFS